MLEGPRTAERGSFTGATLVGCQVAVPIRGGALGSFGGGRFGPLWLLVSIQKKVRLKVFKC